MVHKSFKKKPKIAESDARDDKSYVYAKNNQPYVSQYNKEATR